MPREAGPPVSEIELGRRAYRRQQRRHSILVSATSSIVLVVAIVAVVVNSPGWDRVKTSFFDFAIGWEALPAILEGLWLNVRVLAVAIVLVALFGSVLAVARTLRGPVFAPVRFVSAAYTDIFRGMPLLIVLYLVGFGLPGLRLFGRMPPEFWGTIAIVITYSAYVAEVLRAGIEAVHPAQRVAARSLGLTHNQTLRVVVMPQAIRKVTPALMNDFVSMQKDVGLISVIGAIDGIRRAQFEVAQYANFTPYVVAGLLFVALAWPFIRFTDHLAAKAREREQIGGVV